MLEVSEEVRSCVVEKLKALYYARNTIISSGQVIGIVDDTRVELKVSDMRLFPEAIRGVHGMALEYPNETFQLASLLFEINSAAV